MKDSLYDVSTEIRTFAERENTLKRTTGSSLVTRPAIRPAWGGVWREKILGISAEEVRFVRRGFPADVPGIRERLERAGGAFVDGYNRALRHRGDPQALHAALRELDDDLQGFAHEGAGMGLAIVDSIAPWSASAWRAFLDAHRRYSYLILIGCGWAMARMFRRALPRFARDADPLLWPLIYDGLGFHQAFFHPAKYVRARRRPRLPGYAANAFDQGVGRCLWFVEGASPKRIGATIDTFEPARRHDLWSGTGIACGYAGGLDRDGVTALAARPGEHRPALAQGVASAAMARVDGGNVTPANELACAVLCGVDTHTAALFMREDLARADAARNAQPATDNAQQEPRYEAWRRFAQQRYWS